ncbi:MAG: TIGR02281 family clan AA aspartic protease [Rickettsiales bacterium]|jgi:aspartyl protease family protein|nr:TIGR02281 family clan AA aspartic protease [Rickettsiales bacterium]
MKLLLTIAVITFIALAILLPDGYKYLIIYVILLFFLLLQTLTESKKALVKKLKYLIIWLMIFIIGFIVISYKDVFLNNRIIANLVPGRAEYNPREIIFYAANDNHFYVILEVNGQNIEFLLDTGASDIALSKADATKLGINLNSLNYNKIYHTANGVVKAAQITLDKVIIGDLVFYNVRASVSDGRMGVSLLGISFLRLFSAYKFDANKVVLVK